MSKKYLLPAVIGLVAIVALVFGYLYFTKNSEAKVLAKEKAEAELLANQNDSIANVNAKEAADQKAWKESAQNEASNLQAQLDTIQPLALQADSLKNVAIELEKKLASCVTASKKTGKTSANTANVATAKKLKGNPIVDGIAKTFTYAKSDSLLAKAAPAGYKLIEKPR